MKREADIITAFEIGAVFFDQARKIREANAHFHALFDAPVGADMAFLTNGFVLKKFEKDIDTANGHKFRISPKEKQRRQFHLHVRRFADGFIGLVQDSSDIAKSEAMLASYSLLIEQQNQEIKEKNEQIEIWRNRIETELEQAAHVQDLLVPQQLHSPHIISRCQYLREMSGDFHEMAQADDGSTTLIVGDVAGKGIYAAIMLAQTLTAFRSCHDLPSLTNVIVSMVKMLDGRFPDGLFVALTLVRQSADKQQIEILNLGNPSALLVDAHGTIEQIESAGPAIGILPAEFYQMLPVARISLTNKRLVVFSDGIIDLNLGSDYPAFETSADVAHHALPLMDLFGKQPFEAFFEKIALHEQSDDIVMSCISA